jgi:hypothetical protein
MSGPDEGRIFWDRSNHGARGLSSCERSPRGIASAEWFQSTSVFAVTKPRLKRAYQARHSDPRLTLAVYAEAPRPTATPSTSLAPGSIPREMFHGFDRLVIGARVCGRSSSFR